MSEEQNDLLPCPCCEGKAKLCQWRDTAAPNPTWIECLSCGVMTDSYYDENHLTAKDKARMVWNTRMFTKSKQHTLVREFVARLTENVGFLSHPVNVKLQIERTAKEMGVYL